VPATLSNGTNFTANVPLAAGTNTVSVLAQASTGAPTTQRYQVVATGTAPTSLAYDINGNVATDENGNNYQWDALNRLTKITYPSGASSLFAYDGLSRRVQIVEKDNAGTVTSTKNYLWIGQEMAEERDASNSVNKRFFPQGEQQSGVNYYYTRDHEGSVREMTDGSGNIISRLSYNPYGVTTVVSGTILPTFEWDGMYYHAPSAQYQTWHRTYDPLTARWTRRDPWQEGGGLNLYEFCRDDPTDRVDRNGLAPTMSVTTTPGGPYQSPTDVKIDGVCCKDIRWVQTVSNIYGSKIDRATWKAWWNNDPFVENLNYFPGTPGSNKSPGSGFGDAPGFYATPFGLYIPNPLAVFAYLGHQRFESCAFCYDTKPPKPLGCVTWSQACTVFGTCQITVTGFSSTPSSNFNKFFSP
jgi:RHS repeat-associated protein